MGGRCEVGEDGGEVNRELFRAIQGDLFACDRPWLTPVHKHSSTS